MRQTFFLLLILLSTIANGQRRRTTEFSGDINVLPSAGKFGISSYNNLPYWVNGAGVYKEIETKPTGYYTQVIAYSQLTDTLKLNTVLVSVPFDSSEIFMPPRDSIPAGFYYHFLYQGNDDTTAVLSDITDILYFPDTVWAIQESGDSKTWLPTNYLSSDHPKKYFRLKHPTHFQLYYILPEKRWLVQYREMISFDY